MQYCIYWNVNCGMPVFSHKIVKNRPMKPLKFYAGTDLSYHFVCPFNRELKMNSSVVLKCLGIFIPVTSILGKIWDTIVCIRSCVALHVLFDRLYEPNACNRSRGSLVQYSE